jgi:outer membrane biosynthesis protein TonB
MMAAAAAPEKQCPEAIGFAVALAAHAALLWVLSQDRDDPPPPPADSMEVSFVEEVGPVSSAPETLEPPAPSFGEEMGPTEEASGAAASVPEPVTAPVPEPVRPPVETGERRRPDLTRNPVQIRPAPPPRVAQSQPRPQPQQRVAPQQRQQAQRPPTQQQRTQAQPGQGQGQRSSGFDPRRLAQTLGSGPPAAQGRAPSAPAQLTGAQRQQIARNISGLIAPCAGRAQAPNALARSISVDLRVTVTREGSPTGHSLISSSGTNANNEDYVDDVVGVAMRAVRACSGRIATLPADYYENGWRTFRYRFRFP